MSPFAKGLFLVRVIFLSISLSHKSFIVQPAALITIEPIKKINMIFKHSNSLKLVKGRTHQPGNSKSQKPTGLSNLPSLTHLIYFFGKAFHQPFSNMSVLLIFGVFINNAISS